MTTLSPAPTLAEAIVAALAEGEDATAARLLRRAFGRADCSGTDDLPELLEALAEYFMTTDQPEEAFAAAARAVCMTETRAHEPEGLRCRCRVAEILLRFGLAEEAYAVYATVAQDAPGQTWVHEAAGTGYLDAGEHELALAWLSAGLEIALANGEASCVNRLMGLRRIAMGAFDLPADALDAQAIELLELTRDHQLEDLVALEEIDLTADDPERLIRLVTALRPAKRY
jgi:tetratricopeptide (TPR) repeat protein